MTVRHPLDLKIFQRLIIKLVHTILILGILIFYTYLLDRHNIIGIRIPKNVIPTTR